MEKSIRNFILQSYWKNNLNWLKDLVEIGYFFCTRQSEKSVHIAEIGVDP